MTDRVIVGVLLLVMFTSGADLLVMTPILPAVAQDLGVGDDLAGLWVTAYAGATGVFALAFGPVSDRYGRRTVLRAGMAVLLAGTLACAAAESFFSMIGARFVAGAGAGMLVTSITSYAGDHFAADRRAVVIGWVMSGFFLALIVAVPLGALLAGAFGWSRMFLVLTGFAALVGIGVFLLPHPRGERRSPRLSIRGAVRTYAGLMRRRRVLGVLAMSSSVGLAMTMYSVYTSPWMASAFGLGTAERGLVYAAGGPAVLLGGPLAGRLSNHFGRVSLVVGGSILMGTMQLLMPLTPELGAWIGQWTADAPRFGAVPWPVVAPVVLVFFLTMAAGSARSGPYQTLALEVSPDEQRGAVAALRNGFNQLGSGLGAAIGGFLWSRLDAPYPAVCWGAAAITFAGALALRRFVGSDRPARPVRPSARRP